MHILLKPIILLALLLALLTACAPLPAPTPAPANTAAYTLTMAPASSPTATFTIIAPPSPTASDTAIATQPPASALTEPPTAEPSAQAPLTPQPGLVVRGHVRLADGSALPGVAICRNYASYAGVVVATTDTNGYFESQFAFIPGDEMVAVWPVAPGYVFQPEFERWRHYYGSEDRSLEFTALSGSDDAMPMPSCR